ncbi:hypothetical protein [Pseudoalteromonas sp. OOF1S-7]|uniref:hypothetical protein n=1 Tax=Pseudoalteromonas sp. OOF1S-7 TaxID=2917757 RepID=UPI001EF416E8|nr:hypothetical protein [Pseudoalteromonas sp. OOF1S-7]MCG7535364.1 hypothetical protein [Pseudoalteromonas sp. OOF1S-7]
MSIIRLIKLKKFFLFLCVLSGSSIVNANDILKKTYNPALGQTNYSIETEQCMVAVIAFDKGGINENTLRIKRRCDLGVSIESGLLAIVFSEMKVENKLNGIDSISWGAIQSTELQERLARSSIESPIWLTRIKDSKGKAFPKNIPEVRDILNDGLVFKELVSVLCAMGYSLSVKTVEGILVGLASSHIESFDNQSDIVVPYSANVWFELGRQ